MGYRQVPKTERTGTKVKFQTVIYTGSMAMEDNSDCEFQIFQVKHRHTGLFSFRYFPCNDCDLFLKKGIRYAQGMRLSDVEKALNMFSNLEKIQRDPKNPQHKVFSWTNHWAWGSFEEAPMRQNESNDKYSMQLELNVPATGWKYEFTSPECDTQVGVESRLYANFRQHFQGCLIDWVPRPGDASDDAANSVTLRQKTDSGTEEPPSKSIEEELFG